jgi:hypothetical protein
MEAGAEVFRGDIRRAVALNPAFVSFGKPGV